MLEGPAAPTVIHLDTCIPLLRPHAPDLRSRRFAMRRRTPSNSGLGGSCCVATLYIS
jgi:hypothetical protein